MKSSVFFGTVLSTFLVAGVASADKVNYSADLSIDNENDPATDGMGHNPTGTGTFTFDTTTKTLCGKITYTDLTGAATGIHIHQSPPGQPDADGVAPAQGKLIIPTAVSPVTFNFTLDAKYEASLNAIDPNVEARELYANVHTTANPKGEARGSLVLAADQTAAANVACPAATNPDGGATTSSTSSSSGDAAASSSSSSSSSSASSSGASGSSSSSSGGSNGASTTKAPDAGGDPPAEEEKSGCNTAGAPINALSLAFAVGVGIAAMSSRLRRKKRQ